MDLEAIADSYEAATAAFVDAVASLDPADLAKVAHGNAETLLQL